ncbi:MAG: chloride channel protein [Armatimonadetes bacterium]|nr:chloride channel protein [Armatimonadota bacterium]
MPRPGLLLSLAVLVGLIAGLGAVVFRLMISFFQHAFFEGLGPWLGMVLGDFKYVLIPAIGGLIVGPMFYFFVREAKGHGVPEVMEAVAVHGGRIRPRVSVIKALASSICIGSGGSVGREGPIVQIGSAFGSTLAQLLNQPARVTRTLVACGAAGGIAGTFNAPLAGSFFALELILRDWGAGSFAPVVVSSFCATVVARFFLGDHPAFPVPQYSVASVTELPMFAILGFISAGIGIAFIVLLYGVEDLWDAVPLPEWAKAAPGGLFVGLLGFLALALMGGYDTHKLGVFGVGYETMHLVLSGNMSLLWVIAGLLVLKLLATTMTLGSGGSGGVFAPSLYMGCMAGALFGTIVDTALPGATTSPAAYALVGMGAVFAAASRAPVTSVLIVYEMTQDYRMILPLMLACAVAVAVAQALYRFSIYNLKLVRRGIHIDLAQEPALLSEITVADAMTRDIIAVHPDQSLTALLKLLETTKHHGFPVLDEEGRLHGIVTIGDVRRALARGMADAKAKDIATHDLIVAFPDETLNEALMKLGMRDVGRLPVVDREDHSKLLGLITRKNILSAYNRALMARHTDLDDTIQAEHYD